MCGIAGIFAPGLPRRAASAINQMTVALHHRGPDDFGIWEDAQAGIALGHRRLSIVDLSAAGHQPMPSASGRYVIAFNGEVYNHLELRAELVEAGATPSWRGHSDTETLLACFDKWGIQGTLQKAVGMFAAAVWDRSERSLALVRDRFGEKPLYYGWVDGRFVFASELKGLRAHPGFANDVSREALAQYMRCMYVPAPLSIYSGIYKIEPGCLLVIRECPPVTAPTRPLRAPASYESMTMTRWWSLAESVEKGAQNRFTDETEAIEELENRLTRSVSLQSLADVPLGAFLSGGVDSSTIVALMQRHATRPVKTFTIGFNEPAFDESAHARAVASHLGTEHSELIVSAAEAREVITELPRMFDEPFADSSQIPTYLVSRAARQQVTVALSGDGGDELFGGYNRYFWGPAVWNRVGWLPYGMRRTLGSAITAISPANWDGLGQVVNSLPGHAHRLTRVGDKAHKLAARLRNVRRREDLYLSLVSEWQTQDVLLNDVSSSTLPYLLNDTIPVAAALDERTRMMYLDSMTYLPDDILCKVDRAAMAVSLETRVPFLDYRVAELAWRLPLSMKIRGKQGKWILRELLDRHVPRKLIERPKAGFGIPVGEWLRGPLRAWCEELLDESRLRREGYFQPAAIRAVWHQHLSGRHDWTAKLWGVLMFQAWLSDN
jgi:asparagine synthase (glutamine-hydrolysing)